MSTPAPGRHSPTRDGSHPLEGPVGKPHAPNRSLLIAAAPDRGVQIAFLEDRRLVELANESLTNEYSVGDVYLGRVRKLLPGLNAAFVDVGYEKDAFLHFTDLGPSFRQMHAYVQQAIGGHAKKQLDFVNSPERASQITDLLAKGQAVLVQIAKEPIGTKGPRLTAEVSLAGRFVVLVPFGDYVSVSKRIESLEERKRLKVLIGSIKPKGFGVIVRTASEGKSTSDLLKDLQELEEKWLLAIAEIRTAKTPQKVVREVGRTTGILRDLLNDTFQQIVTDSPEVFEEVREYIHQIAPAQSQIVRLHKGKVPLFEHYEVNRQIRIAFGRTVTMPGGAYLIVDHTEALHVIDVNSGNRTSADVDQETNALNTNMEAAVEIARQLRLRDMGGIIVIDFIDMKRLSNRKALYAHMKALLEEDRARHMILPISKFGLMEITRQRVRPEMQVVTTEKCPMCNGTGQVRSSSVLTDDIEQAVEHLLGHKKLRGLRLHVHPIVAAFLTGHLHRMQRQWLLRHKTWLPIEADAAYHMGEFMFFNKKNEPVTV